MEYQGVVGRRLLAALTLQICSSAATTKATERSPYLLCGTLACKHTSPATTFLNAPTGRRQYVVTVASGGSNPPRGNLLFRTHCFELPTPSHWPALPLTVFHAGSACLLCRAAPAPSHMSDVISSMPPSRGDCGGSDDCGGVVGQLEIIVVVADRRRRHASVSPSRQAAILYLSRAVHPTMLTSKAAVVSTTMTADSYHPHPITINPPPR
ncbi:hypothetical protein BDZ89DRAFT_1121878 [Hymenopellis radicata]|nr:hypothetical protein BDZ89DRAFT_1121878 [Hymenopellis radicata]